MKKRTQVFILLGILVFFFCAASLIFFFYLKGRTSLEAPKFQEGVEKYGTGTKLLETNPLYQKGVLATQQQNFDEARQVFGELRSLYATGTPERNTIDLSFASAAVFSGSTDQSITELQHIVLDEKSYVPLTRAFAIEYMGRTYWAVNNPSILRKIFSGDSFFTNILAESKGDEAAALTKLLAYGYSLSPTPIIAARLAEKAGNSFILNPQFTAAQKQTATRYLVDFLASGSSEIQKMTDPLYAQYRAEFYSIYGGAIASSIIAHVATSYSVMDVEDAYDHAYREADDGFKPYVIYRYGTFLSQITPVDTVKIEDLSKRLSTLTPFQTRLFDSFLRNTLGQDSNDRRYKAIHAYMDASPTFKNYVSTRILVD